MGVHYLAPAGLRESWVIALGDGQELWTSSPFSTPVQYEEFSIDVSGVDQLQLEVRCLGKQNYCWCTWIAPRLERVEPAQPDPTGSVKADKVVIWNSQNGSHRDRGTKRCNLLLYRGTQLVWQQTGIRLPWNGQKSLRHSVAIPNLEFTRLRVEITDTTGPLGSALTEVEVFRGSENLARKAVATSTLTWAENSLQNSYFAPNVNDGKSTDDGIASAILLQDVPNGWIEFEWHGPDKQPHSQLRYQLKRHPETAISFKGNYYSFFAGCITWDDAQKQCKEIGGYLCCVETAEENEFLWKLSGQRSIWRATFVI